MRKCSHCGRLHDCDPSRERLKVIPGLRNMRDRYFLSARDFAELAGITVVTVYNIERGKAARPDTQRKIVEAVAVLKRRQREVEE